MIEFCAKRGIHYTETGLLTSYRLVLSHLSGVAAGWDATRRSDAVGACLVSWRPGHDPCFRPNACPTAGHS